MSWLIVLLAAAICYALKLAGLSVPARWLADDRVQRLAAALPVALLAALIGLQTWSSGHHLVIDGNHLSDSHPYMWGKVDHADFIHIWTSKDQDGPTTGVQVTNNTIEQGDGTAILGINLEDSTHKTFTDVTISGSKLAAKPSGTG